MYALSAFRTYDIRGVRQEEIDEVFGARMGYALGKHILEQEKDPRILVTGDVRLANNILIEEFLKGMKHAGIEQVEVFGVDHERYPRYDYGICSTSLAYYLCQNTMDYSITFSASHNGPTYVGMKIIKKDASYVKSVKLKELFEMAQNDIQVGDFLPHIIEHKTDKIEKLFQDMRSRFDSLSDLPKITIDYSNGAGVHFEQDFLKDVGGNTWEHLFGTPDSNFSNHESDTSRFANYQQLISEIQKNGSDFGFMFDGDVDRIGVCLPDGRVVTGDVILAIIAKQLLESGEADELGSREVFQEVFCSRVVRDVVEEYGGNLHIVPVGRGKFVDEVIQKNGLIAGETSAHILFKEYGTIEMPLLALFYLLRERSNFSNMTEMIDTYMPYVRGQIVHFGHKEKDMVIETFKNKYANYEQNHTDGVRVEGPDRRFTIRKSGTEPIIKVGLEGETQEIYNRVLEEIRGIMSELGAHEE